jgi:putative ABC transport system permease protein
MSLWDWLLRRHQREEELDEEVRSHLRMAAKERIEQGESVEQARVAAAREFGNATLVKEVTRDMWGFQWFEILLQDVRYGARQLRKNPGFTMVAVLTLALGIGANTSIFSAVSAIVLRKPRVEDPNTLCVLSSRDRTGGSDLVWASAPDFKSWRNQNHVFGAMGAALTGRAFTLTGEGKPESVLGDYVTPGYFEIVGVSPSLGRTFLPSEAEPGSGHVVVLSNALWRERYGSSPNILGKGIEINGAPYTVIGVMPPRAATLPMPWVSARLWTPLVFSPTDLTPSARSNHYINMVLARLKPGATLQIAQEQMDAIAHQLAQSYPKTNKGWGVTVLTLQEYLVRILDLRKALTVMMVAVGLVMLLACANIAGLLLARGAGRAYELAVRSAVGASRLRLLRQMLAENLLIGAAGGGAGLVMSIWGVDLLRAGFDLNGLGPLATELRLDRPTLLFTLVVSCLTLIGFGLLPALRASKADPRDALSENVRTGSAGFRRARLRTALVTGEVTLALVLLAAAGVTLREVVREVTEPVGYNPRHLLVSYLDVGSRRYKELSARIALFEQVVRTLRDLSGVERASVDSCVPMDCFFSLSFNIVGRTPSPGSATPSAGFFVVGPDYFRTMQIPLVEGRALSESDNAEAPVVAVVSEEFTRRFFPKGDAIGRWIEVHDGNHKQAQIVGIAGNVNTYPGQMNPEPQIYECYRQIPVNAFSSMALVLRSPLASSSLVPMLRRAVWSVDKDQPLGTIDTMQEIVRRREGVDKLFVALIGMFAGLALALAAVGIYGVIAYSVNQRTHEIGIRMALGAKKQDVLRLVFRQGGAVAGIGCAIGLALALPLPRAFASIFSPFRMQGPGVALVVASIVAVVSLLATCIPARRATKVDPMVALRRE